jgi:hypothetical protein
MYNKYIDIYLIIIFIIIIIIIFLLLNSIKLNKKNINQNILPFSYQYVKEINTANKDVFCKIYSKYYNIEVINEILNIKHTYAPTWGIKIDNKNKLEFEIYFYLYNPFTRKSENKCINFMPNNIDMKNITMYSIDLDNKINSNFNYYYFFSSNENVDIGYSLLNNKKNNFYYRYYYNTIDDKFKKFIDTKLINKNIKNIKTIFVADKLIRNYIGIYYDGITYNQLYYLLKKYNYLSKIDISLFNKKYNYSISIDFNKTNNNIERIGIYGILY